MIGAIGAGFESLAIQDNDLLAGQLDNSTLLKKVKRDIARVRTIMKEKAAK